MKKEDTLIGNILNIDWKGEEGTDILGNIWTREGDQLYISVQSDYRENVGIRSFITVDTNERIENIDCDSYMYQCMGRPQSCSLQKREEKQVEKYLRSIIRKKV